MRGPPCQLNANLRRETCLAGSPSSQFAYRGAGRAFIMQVVQTAIIQILSSSNFFYRESEIYFHGINSLQHMLFQIGSISKEQDCLYSVKCSSAKAGRQKFSEVEGQQN